MYLTDGAGRFTECGIQDQVDRMIYELLLCTTMIYSTPSLSIPKFDEVHYIYYF